MVDPWRRFLTFWWPRNNFELRDALGRVPLCFSDRALPLICSTAKLVSFVSKYAEIGARLTDDPKLCTVRLTTRLTKPRPYVIMLIMAKKVKLPENVLKFFQATGAEGGKARAERHSKEELREWGKKGGRPKGSKDTQPKKKKGEK